MEDGRNKKQKDEKMGSMKKRQAYKIITSF